MLNNDWYEEYRKSLVLINLDNLFRMAEIIKLVREYPCIFKYPILKSGFDRLLELNAINNRTFKEIIDYNKKTEEEGLEFCQMDLYDELDVINDSYDLQEMIFNNILAYINIFEEKKYNEVSLAGVLGDYIDGNRYCNNQLLKTLRIEREEFDNNE